MIGAGLAGIGAMLAGCTGVESVSPGRGGAIQFFNDAASWGPGYKAAGAELLKKTGWSIDPQTIPNATAYEQVVRSLLQTKNPPDLVKWGSGYRMQDLARTGGLADLTNAWEGSVAKGWLDDSLRSAFSYGDGVYGLPLIQGFYVMFYNVAVFDRLGLKAPKTWNEFIDVCESLKAADITPIGTTQVNIWPVANWFSMLATAYDPEWFVRLCDNRASFEDDEAEGLMDLWQKMIDKGYHTSADSLSDNFPAMLQSEKVGMWPTPVSWSSQSLQALGMQSGEDYDAFLLPMVNGDAQSVVTEVAGLVVPERSLNVADVTKAMCSWLDPQVQQPWSDFLSGSSANPTVPWTDKVSQRLQTEIRRDDVQVVNRYWEASPPPLVVGVTQDLGGFMANPNNPEAVLASLNQKAMSEWSYWTEATR
ncbi:ABC transporter substrate-binding protein [Microbacterium murale]|uniref:ABC transporter substrate-binding protein n=1 Tax=Microbacterium murale TaxID=1081040 RepID=UPI00166D78CC|nr:extracellular solute-binding protein [Microbacterium murale]